MGRVDKHYRLYVRRGGGSSDRSDGVQIDQTDHDLDHLDQTDHDLVQIDQIDHDLDHLDPR